MTDDALGRRINFIAKLTITIGELLQESGGGFYGRQH